MLLQNKTAVLYGGGGHVGAGGAGVRAGGARGLFPGADSTRSRRARPGRSSRQTARAP